jgi:uncharacterized hydrophobic protein (TIGR00271 family)
MAFHVRLASPPDLTEQLIEVLAAESGVTHVVVLPGSARRPGRDAVPSATVPSAAGSSGTGRHVMGPPVMGPPVMGPPVMGPPVMGPPETGPFDAVQFDVPLRSANAVLGHLRAIRDHHGSSIAIQNVDAILGEEPGAAAKFGFIQRDAAPVWDVVEARIRSNAVYAPSFFLLLALAGLIGAVGILINSQILIVGAMVVGPEYNAIMGVALGIDKRDRPAIRRGALALLSGFTAAIILTLAFGLAIRWSGATPEQYSDGVQPVAEFISSPDLFSVVVAVLAGIVGVVSLTEARASALIGVFISITTIPAAANIGLSVAYSSWTLARGSVYQLLLNVTVLVVVGALVLRVQRFIWRPKGAARPPDPLAG